MFLRHAIQFSLESNQRAYIVRGLCRQYYKIFDLTCSIVLTGGTQCPAERMLVDTVRCNELPCNTYWWQPSEWNHCEVYSGTCGAGIQHRDALCYKEDGTRTNLKRYGLYSLSSTVLNCGRPSCYFSGFVELNSKTIGCKDSGMDRLNSKHNQYNIM